MVTCSTPGCARKVHSSDVPPRCCMACVTGGHTSECDERAREDALRERAMNPARKP